MSSRNAHTWHRADADTDEQLIDVHAHFLTDAYAFAARRGRLLYGSDYCWTPDHGVDAQLALCDVDGNSGLQ